VVVGPSVLLIFWVCTRSPLGRTPGSSSSSSSSSRRRRRRRRSGYGGIWLIVGPLHPSPASPKIMMESPLVLMVLLVITGLGLTTPTAVVMASSGDDDGGGESSSSSSS